MKLYPCLKKIGPALSDEQKLEVQADVRALKKTGIKAQAAAIQVVNERLQELRELRSDVVSVIETHYKALPKTELDPAYARWH